MEGSKGVLGLEVGSELQRVGLHQLQDLESSEYSRTVLKDVLSWLVGDALESLDFDGHVLLFLLGELNSIADFFDDLVLEGLVVWPFQLQPKASPQLLHSPLLIIFLPFLFLFLSFLLLDVLLLDGLALGLHLFVHGCLLFGQSGFGQGKA